MTSRKQLNERQAATPRTWHLSVVTNAAGWLSTSVCAMSRFGRPHITLHRVAQLVCRQLLLKSTGMSNRLCRRL